MGREEDLKRIKRLMEQETMKIELKDEYVVASQVSWDTLYYDDLANHDGFRIYEPAVLSLDGRKEKNMHGPNSPLFGTTYGDEQAFMERHRCKCGTFKGREYLGYTCPFCHHKVKKVDLDIKKTGWIHLGEGNRVISPYWYIIFQGLIGKDVFDEIVQRIERVDSDGNRHELTPDDEHPPRSQFSGIGIDGFYARYEEILGYFSIKKKNKADSFEKAIKNKDKAFISHIPVYSTFLRPSSVTQDTFYFNGIDKQINTIVNLCISLKDCEDIEKPFIQTRIQERLQKMWRLNFEQVSHKKGLIRNKVISGALNYTSRSVITPDPTLLPNEVDISYQGFRILFKYRIIYHLMILLNISLSDAYKRWSAAYRKDDYVLEVMNYIVEKEQPRILLNRNPTINMYSMLLLKIRKVKPDWRRTTLSVSLYILRGLNADFDGDILNIIAVFEPELIRMLRKFEPMKKYIMNREDGSLNPLFSIAKGNLVNLYEFANFKNEDDLEELDEEKLMTYINETKKKENRKVIYLPNGKIHEINREDLPTVER